MRTEIYTVTARLAAWCNDGRSTEFLWGHERQYHATRESAELACQRLRDHGSKCAEPERYGVEVRTRLDYTRDLFGEQEWRAACHQAGVDPETGTLIGAPALR